MDADSICNDFHLRMTVATTEHERFEQLLSALVPTPDTVVTPETMNAINDARNIVLEAFGSVCEAYYELDDCADEPDPDEAKVMEDAYATIQRWNEEIDQVMVQIKQIVWDSQHGHIRRLITGTHSRSGKRSFRNTVEEPVREEPDTEDGGSEPEEEGSASEEESAGTDAQESVDESEDIVPTSDEGSSEIADTVEPDEEDSTGIVIVTPEDGESESVFEEPVGPQIFIPEEERVKIREEALKEGYALGVSDTVAKLTEIKKADETSDEVAAESKPMGRKPRTTKPKTKAPAKKRGILRKKTEGSE